VRLAVCAAAVVALIAPATAAAFDTEPHYDITPPILQGSLPFRDGDEAEVSYRIDTLGVVPPPDNTPPRLRHLRRRRSPTS